MRIYSSPVFTETTTSNSTITVLGIISEGHMFRIYQAQKGTKYVILKTPVTNDSMLIEVLHREYELACNLNHPCIVSILDFVPDTPVGPAIVMEYIDGLTLDEFVASNPTMEERKSVLNDILDGIDYLHHRGIIHNDLKPDNIIVNSNKAARIIDFGFSASNDSAYKGCIGGSDGYTAPETLNGSGSVGAASDIFTIGRLINLIFGGRKYGKIARRCSKQSSAERPQSIQALRKLIKQKEHQPLIIVSVAAMILIVGFFIVSNINRHKESKQIEQHIAQSIDSVYQKATDKIITQTHQDSVKTEKRIAENIASYAIETEQAEQAKQNQQKQHQEALRKYYIKELAPIYQEAINSAKQQKYKEFIRPIYWRSLNFTNDYQDSILKRYPPISQTQHSDEFLAAMYATRKYMKSIYSLFELKPSIKTLPPTQRDSLARIADSIWMDVITWRLSLPIKTHNQ